MKAKETTPTGPVQMNGWSENKQDGLRACWGPGIGQVANLVATPFAGAWIFEGDMPMRRMLALQDATQWASTGLQNAELQNLLEELNLSVIAGKDLNKIKADVGQRVANITARLNQTPRTALMAMCLPCIVLDGENPFLIEPAATVKKEMLLTDPAAEDFFLSAAQRMLSIFLSA